MGLAPKNILTSPPKKGTYGMVGTNIGGNVWGTNGEYKFQAEPVRPRPATAPDGMASFVCLLAHYGPALLSFAFDAARVVASPARVILQCAISSL
eukprot:1780836-Rhodomonas_salina.2